MSKKYHILKVESRGKSPRRKPRRDIDDYIADLMFIAQMTEADVEQTVIAGLLLEDFD